MATSSAGSCSTAISRVSSLPHIHQRFSMSVSADCFIEGPDRDIGWHLVDDELHRRAPPLDLLGELGRAGRIAAALRSVLCAIR